MFAYLQEFRIIFVSSMVDLNISQGELRSVPTGRRNRRSL